MKLKPGFQIVEVADEFIAVPVGDNASVFRGVVALSEAASFLLKNLESDKDENELVEIMINTYNVDKETATKDVSEFIQQMQEMGIIE